MPSLRLMLLVTLMMLELGSSPALAASAATLVTQQVNGGAPPPPPPPAPDPSPVPDPLPQPGNGPIVAASFPTSVNVITSVQIAILGTGALVTWTTTVPSLTSVSWGSASGAENGSLQETLPRVEHAAYLAGLLPATKYALDLNASSDHGVATYRGIVFTTAKQPALVPIPPIQSAPSQPVSRSPHVVSPPTAPMAQIVPASSSQVDDVCPNVPGIQGFVPLGMARDQGGNCIPLASTDSIVSHPPPAPVADTNRFITFAFVPSFLRTPVSFPIAVSLIRFLTGGNADTLVTHDPSPADPATPIDATGATSVIVLSALILAAAVRGLAILVW